MLIGKLLKGVMSCQTFLPCKYNRNAQEGNSNKYYMNLLSKVGRIIISVIGFLIVWVFLPMGLQKFIADQQQKIVIGIIAKNLAGEGPEAMLGMLLMGAMLKDKDSDE